MNPHEAFARRGLETSTEEVLMALVQSLPDGLCFKDPRGGVRLWNTASELVSGFSVSEALCARELEDVFFLADEWGSHIRPEITSPPPSNCFLRHKKGHFVRVGLRHVVVYSQGGQPLGDLYLFDSMRKVGPEEIRAPHLSWGFQPPRDEWQSWLSPIDPPAGVLIMRIDDLEGIERRMGREITERCIALLERTGAQVVTGNEICRRLENGDVLMTASSPAELGPLGEKIRGLVQSTRVRWWGEIITVTLSVGGANIGSDVTIAEVIRRARECLSTAMRAGGNRIALYDN